MTLFGRVLDERFWAHRQQPDSVRGHRGRGFSPWGCSSTACSPATSGAWDLLAVGITFVVIQLALMVWQHFIR